MEHICLRCKKEFAGQSSRKFCSDDCSNLFKIEETNRRVELGIEKDYRKVKRYLLEKFGNKCEECGLELWLDKLIPLVLDHKDGNHDNNKLKNCRLICNNCDSLTDTYKNRNKGNGRFLRRLRYLQGKSY
jgi:5-methylcytosine-specific restriction endonuclease McrA